VDVYDAPPTVRGALVGRRMLASARGSEELAAAPAPVFQKLPSEGVTAAIRREAAWTARHGTPLDACAVDAEG